VDGYAALISAVLLGTAGLITAWGGVRRGDKAVRAELRKLRRDLLTAEGVIYRLKVLLVRHGLMSEYELLHGDEVPDEEPAGQGPRSNPDEDEE